VTSGVGVLQKVFSENYSLILMDIMLPGMNGYELTREIRKREQEMNCAKAIPIIAITANTFDNDREKCLETGMNELLPKPFSVDELILIINKFTSTDE
jgi:osomolarity two-component system sensor histidine kinase NIK1